MWLPLGAVNLGMVFTMAGLLHPDRSQYPWKSMLTASILVIHLGFFMPNRPGTSRPPGKACLSRCVRAPAPPAFRLEDRLESRRVLADGIEPLIGGALGWQALDTVKEGL